MEHPNHPDDIHEYLRLGYLHDAGFTAGKEARSPWVSLLSALVLGADPTASFTTPPLLLASGANNPLLVQALLKLGVPVNLQHAPSFHHTALHEAVLKNDADTARCLLQAGADPNLRSQGGRTPLHCAAERSGQLTQLLLTHGANPEVRDSRGLTPLDLAHKTRNHTAETLLRDARTSDAHSSVLR
jgi:ankyrin repeat protein